MTDSIIHISLERETELFLLSQKIKDLEIQLGKLRASYLAAEQKYLLERSQLEKEYLNTVKKSATELNLSIEQDWEFIPESKIFKYKGKNG